MDSIFENQRQTHEEIERTRHRARRRQRDARLEEMEAAGGAGNSVAFNFFLISGVLTFVLGLSGAFSGLQLGGGGGGGSGSGSKRKQDG